MRLFGICSPIENIYISLEKCYPARLLGILSKKMKKAQQKRKKIVLSSVPSRKRKNSAIQ